MAGKPQLWQGALKRAIARKYGDLPNGLDAIAMRYINYIAEADVKEAYPHFKELSDRLDGKPAQSVTVSGDEDNPLQSVNEIIIRGVDVNG